MNQFIFLVLVFEKFRIARNIDQVDDYLPLHIINFFICTELFIKYKSEVPYAIRKLNRYIAQHDRTEVNKSLHTIFCCHNNTLCFVKFQFKSSTAHQLIYFTEIYTNFSFCVINAFKKEINLGFICIIMFKKLLSF